MSAKWTPPLLAVVVGLAALAGSKAQAGPPWENLLIPKRVEADPHRSYELTDQCGPWMIMACSFSGDQAERQAHDLVLELRARWKVPAYVYRAQFDLGRAEGRGVDRYGNPVRMRYQHGSEIKEVAVVVGNYRTADDAEAKSTLQTLKYAQPDCLQTEEARRTRDVAGLRDWYHMEWTKAFQSNAEPKQRGPMGHAFIAANPLLPQDYFVPKGVDKLVEELNEGLEFSLLRCPGKYTVRVAHFTGNAAIRVRDIQAIKSGEKDLPPALADAAKRAHSLCLALRNKYGVEAYEFHDRYSSIVTVGSFHSLGTPRPDGKIAIDPEIYAVMKKYGAETYTTPNGTTAMKGLALKDIAAFDPQPMPMEVPRRSIAADYRRDSLSTR